VAMPGGLLRARLLHRIHRAGPGAGARTGRLRSQIGAAIGDAARSVNEVAAAHGVSWPTAHRAFVAHADELLGEPEPTRVLGIDATRRGKPRWEYRAETARWVRVDPWDTGFVDLTPVYDRTGPARLLDVVAGQSAAALASWLSAQTADFAQTVQVIAMDGFAGYKTAAAQVMS
jgi:transposase